jgi:hypothetical protein
MGRPKIGIAVASRYIFKAKSGSSGVAMRLGKAGGRIGFEFADLALGDGCGGCQHLGQVSVLAALASSSQISSSALSSW